MVSVCGDTGVGWTVSLWICSSVSLVGRSVSGGTWLSVMYWHSVAEHGIPAMVAVLHWSVVINKLNKAFSIYLFKE